MVCEEINHGKKEFANTLQQFGCSTDSVMACCCVEKDECYDRHLPKFYYWTEKTIPLSAI